MVTTNAGNWSIINKIQFSPLFYWICNNEREINVRHLYENYVSSLQKYTETINIYYREIIGYDDEFGATFTANNINPISLL